MDQARCQVWSLRTVTENLVRCLDQPQCATLVTSDGTRAQNNDAAGGRCVPRTGQEISCGDRTEEGASRAGHRSRSHRCEGDALDQPGYFIGRGLAFRKCGVHGSEAFLPWAAARERAHQEADSTRIWLRGEVCVGSGVSQVNEGFGAKLKTDCGTAANRG